MALLSGSGHTDEAGAQPLPTPEEFAARAQAGTLDPKMFDFAAAGYRKQPDCER